MAEPSRHSESDSDKPTEQIDLAQIIIHDPTQFPTHKIAAQEDKEQIVEKEVDNPKSPKSTSKLPPENRNSKIEVEDIKISSEVNISEEKDKFEFEINRQNEIKYDRKYQIEEAGKEEEIDYENIENSLPKFDNKEYCDLYTNMEECRSKLKRLLIINISYNSFIGAICLFTIFYFFFNSRGYGDYIIWLFFSIISTFPLVPVCLIANGNHGIYYENHRRNTLLSYILISLCILDALIFLVSFIIFKYSDFTFQGVIDRDSAALHSLLGLMFIITNSITILLLLFLIYAYKTYIPLMMGYADMTEVKTKYDDFLEEKRKKMMIEQGEKRRASLLEPVSNGNKRKKKIGTGKSNRRKSATDQKAVFFKENI